MSGYAFSCGDRPTRWRSSLGIDEKGYLHASGVMYWWPHRTKWPEGIPEDRREAPVLYWRTSLPLDIHSFEFLGHDEENAPPSFGYYGALVYESGHWRFINDNQGRLYAYVPSVNVKGGGAPVEDGLQGFAFSRFNTETMKWDNLGGEVPGTGVKMLMYELASDEDTHVQCNFDRMDILQCIFSFEKQFYYGRSCDYGETFYTSEGRLIELPMSTFDEAHTPEYVAPNSQGSSSIDTGRAIVSILEDGSPFVVQSGGPRTFHAKNYETGKWEEIWKDYWTRSQENWPVNTFFMDKLGVSVADNYRRWLVRDWDMDQAERNLVLDAITYRTHWCDERYYKDTGDLMCWASWDTDYREQRAVKTTINRPVQYPAKWA